MQPSILRFSSIIWKTERRGNSARAAGNGPVVGDPFLLHLPQAPSGNLPLGAGRRQRVPGDSKAKRCCRKRPMGPFLSRGRKATPPHQTWPGSNYLVQERREQGPLLLVALQNRACVFSEFDLACAGQGRGIWRPGPAHCTAAPGKGRQKPAVFPYVGESSDRFCAIGFRETEKVQPTDPHIPECPRSNSPAPWTVLRYIFVPACPAAGPSQKCPFAENQAK